MEWRHAHARTRTPSDTHTPTHLHIYADAHVHLCTHAFRRTQIYTPTPSQHCTYTQTPSHTHTHTHTHASMHLSIYATTTSTTATRNKCCAQHKNTAYSDQQKKIPSGALTTHARNRPTWSQPYGVKVLPENSDDVLCSLVKADATIYSQYKYTLNKTTLTTLTKLPDADRRKTTNNCRGMGRMSPACPFKTHVSYVTACVVAIINCYL